MQSSDVIPVMNRCISVVLSFKSSCQLLAPVYRSVYILASQFMDFNNVNTDDTLVFRFLFYWSFADSSCREFKLFVNSVTKRMIGIWIIFRSKLY